MNLSFKIKLDTTQDQFNTFNNWSKESIMFYNYILNEIYTDYYNALDLNIKPKFNYEHYQLMIKYFGYKYPIYYFISSYVKANKSKYKHIQKQIGTLDYKFDVNYLTFDHKKDILRNIRGSFKGFFTKNQKGDKDARPPMFLNINKFRSISVTQDFILKHDNNLLNLSLNNRKYLNFKLNFNEPIKNLSCLRHKTNESQIKKLIITKEYKSIYAVFQYETKETDIKDVHILQPKDFLSIDPGVDSMLTIYDPQINKGVNFSSEKFIKYQTYYDERIDNLRSLRDKKVYRSRKWRKINRKIKSLYVKKGNQRKLILHKVSKDLASLDRNIIIGNLKDIEKTSLKNKNSKPKDQRKNKNEQNRARNENWPIKHLMDLIEYKLQLRGLNLVRIDEHYTSKTCSSCGHVKASGEKISDSNRLYVCNKCGLTMDRDINASINILNKYVKEQQDIVDNNLTTIYKGFYNKPTETKVSKRSNWCNVYQLSRQTEFIL